MPNEKRTDNFIPSIVAYDAGIDDTIPVTGDTLTNAKPMHVAIVDGDGNQITSFGGSGGTSSTDDSAFTAGSGVGTPIMGFATSDSVDSGDVGVVGMNTSRALYVSIQEDSVGIGGGTQYTEDGVAASNPVGNALILVRDDSLSGSITSADGDNIAARANNKGEQYVKSTDSDALLTTIDADTSNISTNSDTLAGAVSGTEMQVDVVAPLPAGTNAIGKLAANSGVDIGDVDVTSISAGTNLIGDVGISGTRTSGGTTPYKNLDVDETEDQVKATAGQVYWIHAINTTDAPLYLKFYNATAASVTVGTTTPIMTFPVPGNANSDGAGFTLSIPNGIAFDTAITIAATTAVADNDTGAPSANALIVNLGYS